MHPAGASLPEVVDRARSGHAARTRTLLASAVDRFAERGQRVRRPVRAALEELGVPGFTETQIEAHVLHLQASAAPQPWFPGLLVRQVAHASLTDAGHASHDPGLLQASFAAAKQRSKALPFLGRIGALNHHVRDAYADDLAAFVDAESLGPFLDHLAVLAAQEQGPDRAVEVAYAAGTLRRRGAPLPPALDAALDEAGARSLAEGFAALHPDPEPEALEQALLALVAQVPEA
jgi:hypothetical protein